ncbi:RNA 3'-terminal phosphate cyclase [Massilia sp. Dwa41.01b]|uniref:RNA 3'-terminal phosphate cyclase n=1 Tax=unclassified Massilia TaxID=2609279 RepID=UPI0016042E1D|nr:MULTISPECIES: RNA 3'-terminal phosphate cyclase [unclassified Massilia]QNA87805.1 RNA 3'-terminal phosphate cyclase [Massilia sp. Dwa41.01b]QNA98706.1 RNA 3'-terminal phosphate cyclase [Massilia sp. Se16.2.3]
MIELDGATGEGGGQILRTALTLSMITGQPFHIANIRANRPKPGLMRQHLVAVQAAAEVSGATVTHAQVGSTELTFTPGRIRAGDYQFAIGTAGSCTLVLQTLMLALLHADGPSTIRISGGTHNAMAPPVQFLQLAYCPLLASMGAEVEIELLRYGFYPAGGGSVAASIKPCARLGRIELMAPGRLVSGQAQAYFAGIPASVGTRELDTVAKILKWEEAQLHMRQLPREQGPGNALLITVEHEAVTEVFAGFGAKGVSAETVARHAASEARAYLASGAAVGEHLADQLMLPMALAGGGRFTTSTVSGHASTNAAVIERFLPVSVSFAAGERGYTCAIESTCQAG